LPEETIAPDCDSFLLFCEGEIMTTCVDFYKKWEKNPNWCKKSEKTAQEIERYQTLLKELEEMGVLKERVIRAIPRSAAQPLMAISDPEKQKEAISDVANALNRKTPTGGAYKKKLKKPDIEKIVEKVVPPETKKFDGSRSFAPAPHSIPVTDRPPQPSLAAQMKGEQPAPIQTAAPAVSQDPVKAKAVEMNRLAEALLELMPKSIQLIATDVMREHPSYKVKDVFYYGIEALGYQKTKR
jgi:hypothetical protein